MEPSSCQTGIYSYVQRHAVDARTLLGHPLRSSASATLQDVLCTIAAGLL
jgi:hypothetical protein